MRRLPDQPSKHEVRRYAGLTAREWDDVFVAIITKEARRLREQDPDILWRALSQEAKNAIVNNVNQKLAEKSIRPVSLEVVGKRLGLSLTRMKHEARKKALAAKQKASTNAAAVATSMPAQRARPYDPVRDL
ncbi:hypothetical protein COCC4DRAFT_74972 [Bipolaris maydis ATCC 48331]|uniref:Uncharacterized protein n=2 Tax=Cochliobolus heterostrophus TaxID=5016 RepID=M2U813_COCH5|nr:uncharacterized protein COCC4DRAFT_74972 [Bipolaris maydis ATCC 48331]EMD94679.1 hypothetical protein COCHEDRAFT_1191503 [Bipolaris maydis C5]ENI01609.1 hypothetical protein COCC4DRAFT_74972 [Bipolaris maydis ATCC 48331]KAJ6215144.1 hypothetical protein PSV09DRAFT_1191503 [Bipolaris maydis]